MLPSGLSALQMKRLRQLAAVADGVKLVSQFTRDVTHVVTNDECGAIKVRSLQSCPCVDWTRRRHRDTASSRAYQVSCRRRRTPHCVARGGGRGRQQEGRLLSVVRVAMPRRRHGWRRA